MEQQEFHSRALSEPSQVLNQLLGFASELNGSSVLRAVARIPAGLPVGSAIYQLPRSIFSQLEARGRGYFDGLTEMWPDEDITKGKPSRLASTVTSSSEQRHFAVRLFSDDGVVVADTTSRRARPGRAQDTDYGQGQT